MESTQFDADYQEDLTLSDGRRLRFRLLRPTDKRRLSAGFQRLSPESRYRRFFVAKKELTRTELRALTEFDANNQVAIGAVELLPNDEEGVGVGVARFFRFAEEPDVADFSIVVADEWQGKGVGRLLLERLLAAAAERNIRRIRCHLLAENEAVRKLINAVSTGAVFKRESELLRAEFSVSPTKAEERAARFPRDTDVFALLRWIATGAALAPIAFAMHPVQKVLEKMRSYRILPQRWLVKEMNRATIDGVELEYEVRGTGEPVVLMHAGVCAGFFKPLMEEPALVERYRLLRYHRAGYANSGRLVGAVSIAQQAAHCRSLMRHLGIERAHIVGHSSSAMMALQLALDAPGAVQSLALLDAARPSPPSELQMEFIKSVVQPALQRYGAGDKAGAIDIWMQGVCGPGYRDVLERALPGAFEQAVADADTFFAQELPAVQQWTFTPEHATRVGQPVLAVLGANSRPTFRERHELLLAWLPNVEPFVLSDATHLLQVQNPRGMAEGLSAFFARHPLSSAS